MNEIVLWLEAHDKLAGWAQFIGAMATLFATYLTAFIPIWNRKKQLKQAGARLLSHGYEVVESYHRTTPNFLPTSLSLRGGALAVGAVIDEIGRFPVYELDDQGSRSLARHLVAMRANLLAVRLVFETTASSVEGREASEAERDMLVEFLGQQVELVRKMLAGAVVGRPTWTPI